MDYEIRQAAAGEWAVLRDVRLTALADTPDAFASTLAREQDYDEDRWRQWTARTPSFLAWRDGRAVGLVGAYQLSAAEWHVVAMWVAPAERGTGAACALIEAVTEFARGQQASTISLWVTDGNDRAAAFYQRAGFHSTGLRQPVPGKPHQDEEEMARSLA